MDGVMHMNQIKIKPYDNKAPIIDIDMLIILKNSSTVFITK
jgi:hypothetical protein